MDYKHAFLPHGVSSYRILIGVVAFAPSIAQSLAVVRDNYSYFLIVSRTNPVMTEGLSGFPALRIGRGGGRGGQPCGL